MSVINQVLNQLEQRGASAPQELIMVRAVPINRHRRLLSLLALALMLAFALVLANGITELQWRQIFKPKLVASGAVRHVESSAAPYTESAEGMPKEIIPPASRLSFELGSVPLPYIPKQVKAPRENDKRPAAPLPAEQNSPPIVQAVVEPASSVPVMKYVSPAQQADADYRRATELMQQGRINDAIAGFETILRLDFGHDAARQALVALLLEARRGEEAERVLQDRLKVKPENTAFAMLLARLQMEHGLVDQAEATLERSLPYAYAQANYQAFFAALLQRQNRHKEAAGHFHAALQLAPDNGVWQMGYGISLQALLRTDEARDAYRRALETKTLNQELQVFVQQKLKGL